MPLIGAYIPLSNLDHLPDLEEELNHFPDRNPVVLVDPNSYIVRLRNP